ncbi:RpoE-regulated lipoprotein [Pantoea osteomyelitidis]|uniref:RpoE-regulated lipoprotein n=1 Tax=Pantoea osteomyelitidis TaxID=3230026 RepID=A0ABW7PRW4_9GAMM
MKAVRPAILIAAMLLAGCASSGSGTANQGSWWNPFSKISWSAMAPWNWFGSSLDVTEQGVGGLSSSTAMTQQAIDDGLNGDYKLRQGMRGQNGQVITFWQALDDDQVKLVIYGQSSVERIEVMDRAIASANGPRLGSQFSDTFSKAFNHCQKATGMDNSDVECKAPGSQHIRYVYSGAWHGPDGLMPSDDTLKSWTLSKIIWQR